MSLLIIRIVVAALVVFSVSAHSAELEAPLGLQWGQTQKQLKAQGVRFSDCENDKGFTQCIAKNLPKPVSFAEGYVLYFHSGLQRALISGEVITNDAYGTQGKKQFADLKRRLTAKYGKTSHDASLEAVGGKLYNDSDEFYQCLAYDGCGFWVATWRIGEAYVSLQLTGLARGKGRVGITYESKDFRRLIRKAKAQQADTDDAGL